MALALLAIAAAAAGAQGIAVVVDVGAAQGLKVRVAELRVTGSVTVQFRGDRAAGCEAAGNCDVAGAIVWTPPRAGTLAAVQYIEHARRYTEGFLDLGFFHSTASGAVASVRRGDAGTCSDVAAAGGLVNMPARVGRNVNFVLAAAGSPDPFDTRCPGPLAEDLRGALATPALRFRAIRRGARIDFTGVRPFAAHGLAGAVRSTLALEVTGLRRLPTQGPFLRFRRAPRFRIVAASYRIDQAVGRLAIDYAGRSSHTACSPVDSCGVTGTMTLDPGDSTGVMTVTAVGSARRPRKDFLTALGLARGGRRGGIEVAGYGFLSGAGTTSTETSRAGAPACRDSSPLTSGLLSAFPGRRAWRLGYGTPYGGGGPRTRCPGPLLASLNDPALLAEGSMPFGDLARPLSVVHMRTGTFLTERGYSVRTHPDLGIALEPRGVSSYTFSGGP